MEAVLARKHILQNAATTGNGVAANLKGQCRYNTIYIIGSAGVGAGAIQLETASDHDYSGVWAPIGSPVTVVASEQEIVQVTGVFGAIRARISTTVTGGTVTVALFSN